MDRGSLLELNAEGGEPRWLQPGDEVALQAPGLGRLGALII
jgi:hypothetical protein